MGSLLVLFAPMVAGLAYYSSKMWVKVLAVCATGMMCLSCIFTFSKGAWGGLAVAVVIFAIFLDRRLIALMGVAGVGALLAIPSIANRITYLFTADYLAASRRAGRVIRWSKGLKLLQESNPVLGFGLGRFGGAVAMQNKVIEETKDFSYFYMDNYYLKTLAPNGVCSITGKPDFIPPTYPKGIRNSRDSAKLFVGGAPQKQKENLNSMPGINPGYVISQKIIHTSCWKINPKREV